MPLQGKSIEEYRKAMADLPTCMVDGIYHYIEHRLRPGDFLYSVLCNDFYKSCALADMNNSGCLKGWAMFVCYQLPEESYGSRKLVDTWLKGK